MIKLIRIDYRLLHGQVVVGWLNKLGIDRIVIVDNKAGSSDSEKSILNIAKPSGAKMHIFTVEEALARKIKLSNLKENRDHLQSDTMITKKPNQKEDLYGTYYTTNSTGFGKKDYKKMD